MPATTRTFVAVALPEVQRSRLAKLRAQLEPEVPGARWVAAEHYHVTLAFLGDVADADLAAVCRAVAGAAAPLGRFELELTGLGAFPGPARPRVLWAGIAGEGVATLAALHRAVAAATRAAGYPPDDGKFHPHVTLARFKPTRATPSPDLAALVARRQGWTAGTFPVAEAVTFASTLTPDGPAYTRLATAPLTGRNPPAPP